MRIRWYLEMVANAVSHAKEVKDYAFLKKIREEAQEYMLIMERENPDNPDIQKVKAQIEIIDKILSYVG